MLKFNCIGDYSEVGTPVPIPNTEVKPRRAYGTAFQDVGESVNAKTVRRKEKLSVIQRH